MGTANSAATYRVSEINLFSSAFGLRQRPSKRSNAQRVPKLNLHTREHRAVILSRGNVMLHSFAEEPKGRRQRAAAAASDSLVVQSFAPVPPPFQTVGVSSSPRGRSSSADSILKRASFCTHGRKRSECKDCGGSGICTHGRKRSECKDCGGSGICTHGRRRSECKDCGGGSICTHGRIRHDCKDCSLLV
jgi:hypothetical protein